MSYQQGVMFDHWKMIAKKWRDPDCIVLNGDLIDGPAKADRGSSVWTVDMDAQAQEFKKLFSYWQPFYYLLLTTYKIKKCTCLGKLNR